MRPVAPKLQFYPANQLPQSPSLARKFAQSQLKKAILIASLGLNALVLSACSSIPTPRSRASEAAREMNQAARWGRMDIAMQATFEEYRSEFLKNRASWHSQLRILDTEMAGLTLPESDKAIVQVDISWLLVDNSDLRVTRIEQEWGNHKGSWLIESEKRVSGATGLFGEEVERAEEKRDKQFPTRVIR